MGEQQVSLREAKARLSELTECAAAGIDVVIAKHGRPVARLTQPKALRKRVDLTQLQALTHGMPLQRQGAGRALRRLREGTRY